MLKGILYGSVGFMSAWLYTYLWCKAFPETPSNFLQTLFFGFGLVTFVMVSLLGLWATSVHIDLRDVKFAKKQKVNLNACHKCGEEIFLDCQHVCFNKIKHLHDFYKD